MTYFRTVAELGSFSKAAAVLHTTQPSLSRQVMALERELECELFVRTSRGVVLTPAGAGLQRHLAVVFAQLAQIPEVLRAASQDKELFRVGVPQGLPYRFAQALVESVESLVPTVSVWLHEATTEEQRQLLQTGLIDLGLIHMNAPELHSVQIFSQQIGVAVMPGSSLANHREVTFANLNGLTVMAHAAGEVNVEETRLRSASAVAGADTRWVFRRFAEHSELIAITSQVDAVLVTEASALRHLPGWVWIPVNDLDVSGQVLDIGTWAAWREPAPRKLQRIIAAIKAAMAEARQGTSAGAAASQPSPPRTVEL